MLVITSDGVKVVGGDVFSPRNSKALITMLKV